MRLSLAEQGSQQWKIERAGVITGSGMKSVITTKGALSTSHLAYARRLASELITGEPQTKDYKSESMEKGNIAESGAMEAFNQFKAPDLYEQVGLVFKDEESRIGCSPDMVLWEDGKIISGCEMKNPEAHTHVEYLETDFSDGTCPYYQQVQGCIWVCDTDHWWFQSMCPGLKPLRLYVPRNDIYIAQMNQHCETVMRETERVIQEHAA